jgi:hypothetical protein
MSDVCMVHVCQINRWWDFDNTCEYLTTHRVWACDWQPRKTIGFIGAYATGLINTGYYCDSTLYDSGYCNGQTAPYTVGYMSQWGTGRGTSSNYSVALSPWVGVAGLTGTGWYWRPKTSSNFVGISAATPYNSTVQIDGAPSNFRVISTTNMPRGHFIIVAVRYPANTNFTVRLASEWWGIAPYDPMPMSTKAQVFNNTEVLAPVSQMKCTGNWQGMCQWWGGSVGPAWHFDGTHLYIRKVPVACYTINQYQWCDAYFKSYGANVSSINSGWHYQINASCTGCKVQSTYAGVTYWDVPDEAPTTRFPTNYGDAIAAPMPPAKSRPYHTCAASSSVTINGGWSAWSPSTCTVNGATQTRTCTNPAPSNGGDTCTGISTQTCTVSMSGAIHITGITMIMLVLLVVMSVIFTSLF